MKTLCLLLTIIPAAAVAQTAPALHPDSIATTAVSPGVLLKELTGRTSHPGARSTQASVAFFHLDPGRASAWSYSVDRQHIPGGQARVVHSDSGEHGTVHSRQQ